MNKKAMILIVGFVVVLLLSSNISFAEEEKLYMIKLLAMSLLVTKQITLYQQIRLLAE
jgi:hypothetical protein